MAARGRRRVAGGSLQVAGLTGLPGRAGLTGLPGRAGLTGLPGRAGLTGLGEYRAARLAAAARPAHTKGAAPMPLGFS